MDGASQHSTQAPTANQTGFLLDPELDFLDIAGQTDGYMPGDLVLLIARARNEALIRSVREDAIHSDSSIVQLSRADFDSALAGFRLPHSGMSPFKARQQLFDSIGGLQETRRVLLRDASVSCKVCAYLRTVPLRLRSGLLLYGYPGCGKTLLASAVAGECGLNFISVKGPEIFEQPISAHPKKACGISSSEPRLQSPVSCSLMSLIRSPPSVATIPQASPTGLLISSSPQMDGAEGLSGVYVLAATSRPDLIDPALLRQVDWTRASSVTSPTLRTTSTSSKHWQRR